MTEAEAQALLTRAVAARVAEIAAEAVRHGTHAADVAAVVAKATEVLVAGRARLAKLYHNSEQGRRRDPSGRLTH